MPFISRQRGALAEIVKVRLYDFAMALMRAGSASDTLERALTLNRNALTCLLASRPSIKEDHEFWTCACQFNIAQATKNKDDITAAIESAEQILSGKAKVPERCVQGAKEMLNKLRGL